MKKLIYSDINPLQDLGLDYYLKEDNLLYVVPYYEMEDTINEKVLRNDVSKGIEVKDIVSIDHLFRELYFKVDGSYQILRDSELKYILEEVLVEEDYIYFDQNSTKYLLDFINNLDAEMIDLSEYKVEDFVLREIIEICHLFKEKLKKKGFISKWQAYQLLLARLTVEDFSYLYPEIKRIFLDRFYVIRRVELELILKVADYMEDFVVLIDYYQEKKKLFANLDNVVDRLKAEGFLLDNKSNQDNQLLVDIFSNQIKEKKYNWKKHMGNRLKIVESKNRIDELNFVAKEIRELAREGVALDRIGVSFSSPEDYLADLPRVFDDYHLPYTNGISLPLISSPLSKAVLSLLEILDGNFDNDELLAVVDNSFIDFGLAKSLTDELEMILKRLRFEVRGWNLVSKMEVESEKVEQEEIKDILKLFRDCLEWDLKEKISLRQFIEEISGLLSSLNFGVKAGLEEDDDLLAAWKGIQGAIEILNKVFVTEQKKLGEWIDLLKAAILEGKYKLATKQGIKVTGNLELRAGDFDYIFLIGMSHSQYPALIQNPLQRYLDLLEVDLEDKQVKERYTLFNNILAANQEVVITYSPAQDEENPLLTSYLQELFRVVDSQELLIKAEIGNEVFYSIKEAQKIIGNRLNKEDKVELAKEYQWFENLKNSFELNKKRNSEEFSNYRGLLKDEDNLKWLEDKFDKDYNYSAYLLESYGSCPFAFLFDYIFKLGEVEYEEELHPIERGAILHEIVEKFYDNLGERVNQDNYKKAQEELLKVAEEVISSYPLFKDNFYWQAEGHRYLQGQDLGPVFEEFLAAEQKAKLGRIKIDDFSFERVEWKFEDLELIEDYKFTGRVDRIDHSKEKDAYAVIDYKSGKVSNKTLTTNPIQIPLYILAVEKHFGKEVAFGSYYGLRSDDQIGYKSVIHSGVMQKSNQEKRNEKFRVKLEETKEVIKACIKGIKGGNYSIGDQQSACNYCQSQMICRREEF
ncbi:PD-(D/E)XK nuclease family protein [Orenia marismortui]|uniref:ATP-dependent helicase/DNAse subunit B n=1 Tax=Orenia marismortui TaxID=46469 RepID=A0A4V3GYL0_9FIRM|nr:PD-(D/E)XK nuclease family protein [Orenia marismortui]TDX53231.1 ATP-dependent helicase/DNAse subunit B [Orenia marismortui]